VVQVRLRLGRIVAIGAVLLILAMVFAVLWRNEVGHKRATARELRATRGQLRATRAQYAVLASDYKRATAQLQSTTSLSNRRASVLRQTQTVLHGVEPLLSQVDQLQSITGAIQTDRDAFNQTAQSMVTDLASLLSYVVGTDPSYYDLSYIDSIIGSIRSENSTATSQLGALAADDSRYAKASDTFSQRATAFSDAVRKLQQELKAALHQ